MRVAGSVGQAPVRRSRRFARRVPLSAGHPGSREDSVPYRGRGPPKSRHRRASLPSATGALWWSNSYATPEAMWGPRPALQSAAVRLFALTRPLCAFSGARTAKGSRASLAKLTLCNLRHKTDYKAGQTCSSLLLGRPIRRFPPWSSSPRSGLGTAQASHY